MKLLSGKLATLLALATGHRVQTLSLVKIENIKLTKEGAEIKIPDNIKTSQRGKVTL